MELLDKLKKMISQRKGTAAAPGAGRTIDKKIIIIGASLVVSIVLMVFLFGLETRLSSQIKSYTAVGSEQQLISQQIVVNAFDAVAGKSAAFGLLVANQNRYLETLKILDEAANSRSLSLLTSDFSLEYSNLKDIWTSYNKNIGTVTAARKSIESVRQSVNQIKESLPQLKSLSREVVKSLVRAKAPQRNIALAASQLALLGDIENNLNQISTDGKVVLATTDRISGASQLIEKQLIAMLEGDSSLGIKRFTRSVVVGKLVQFADLFSVVKRNLKQVFDNSAAIFEADRATLKLQSLSPGILTASTGLLAKFSTWDTQLR
ncbi:MAG: hypothetical protein ACC663_13220, partial [Gammaproteobacteria bacterium]